jgi:ubiquinone/menaquinone biosynthesis C-methylase UbiE
MAEAERVRRLYNKRAAGYDTVADRKALDRMRAALFSRARGAVLELGVGTGATFAHYPRDLTSLTGLDISEGMLARARTRAAALPFPVELRARDFQTLPFPAAAFDTVVSSLALCGIPDPAALFAEIRRVLRPGGRLLALEHVRPPHPLLGFAADLADPLNERFVGCHLNRRTPALLRAAGFEVRELDRRLFRALVALVATPRAAEAGAA